MTDDISKVVREWRAETKAGLEKVMDKLQARISELESTTTPAEVGEVDHFAVSWRGDWNSTMRGYAEEYARRANATLARQLAEATDRRDCWERLWNKADARADAQAERAEQAESQLAEATRRLGEAARHADQAMAHLSNALDDLDSSPDQRPVPLIREAMHHVRSILDREGP